MTCMQLRLSRKQAFWQTSQTALYSCQKLPPETTEVKQRLTLNILRDKRDDLAVSHGIYMYLPTSSFSLGTVLLPALILRDECSVTQLLPCRVHTDLGLWGITAQLLKPFKPRPWQVHTLSCQLDNQTVGNLVSDCSHSLIELAVCYQAALIEPATSEGYRPCFVSARLDGWMEEKMLFLFVARTALTKAQIRRTRNML